MSALTRFFAGAIHGRTHRSAPTQCRKRSGTNGKWSGTVPLRGGTKPAPYRCTTVGSSERADVDIGPSAAEAAWRSGGWLGPARRRGSGTPDRRALRGKVQEGETPSWFPALAPERSWIIFPGDMCGGKNSSHGATCEQDPAPRGWVLFAPKRSAAMPEGPRHRAAMRHGALQKITDHFPGGVYGGKIP